jgi:hypothetical protein
MGYKKVEAGFAQMVATIGGIIVNGIESIEYSDTRDKQKNWGAGSNSVSTSYGKYEAKGKISLHMSEVEALQAIAPENDLTLLAPFDIIVTFPALTGTGYVINKLKGCEFMGNGRTMKVGDMMFVAELDLLIDKISWA